MAEEVKGEKIAVCRLQKDGSTVQCDVYEGGEFIGRKTVPKEKVKDLFSD
jgi:hypothetical protein